MTRPTAFSPWKTSVSGGGSLDLEDAQLPVRLAAVVEPRNRLLPRVAALLRREADVSLVQAGLGGKDAIVDLAAPARARRQDAHALEILVGGGLGRGLGVQELDRRDAVVVVRDPFALAEDDQRRVLLGLDLDLRREACAKEGTLQGGAKAGLGQEEKVVLAASDDRHRGDHAGLGRQQESLAGRLRDLVREHAVEEVRRVRTPDGDVVARPDRCRRCHCLHAN